MHRMATMKRRVIYVSDAEWADWQWVANGDGVSVSELIRTAMLDETALDDEPLPPRGPRQRSDLNGPTGDLSDVLGTVAVNASTGRPAFRPAPKPSQKGK